MRLSRASYAGIVQMLAPAAPAAAWASEIMYVCHTTAPVSGSSAASEPRAKQHGCTVVVVNVSSFDATGTSTSGRHPDDVRTRATLGDPQIAGWPSVLLG